MPIDYSKRDRLAASSDECSGDGSRSSPEGQELESDAALPPLAPAPDQETAPGVALGLEVLEKTRGHMEYLGTLAAPLGRKCEKTGRSLRTACEGCRVLLYEKRLGPTR